MKIQSKKILKPLVNFYFLKNQFYKQLFNSTCLNNLTLEFKNCLKIIYLYEKKKKNIIFRF